MNRQNKRQSAQGIMTKQTYVILGIILIIVLIFAGAVFVREKKQRSVEPITPPAPVTPTPPTPTPETRQPENSPNTQTPKPPEGWKTYENKEFGFAFDYPGELSVGAPREYSTEYGKQIYIPIDRPEMEFGIRIHQGLNIKQLEDRVEKTFTNSEYYISSNIEKHEVTIGNTRGLLLIVFSKTKFTEGTSKIFILENPFDHIISFEINPNNYVSSSERILESIRFFEK